MSWTMACDVRYGGLKRKGLALLSESADP